VVDKEWIERMLVELKDTSELMVDLAYSALLHQDEEIAREVLELEEHMDDLHTEFELSVFSLREERRVREILGFIRLGTAAENIADAAAEIASVVCYGVKPHPVFEMALKETEETVLRTRLAEDSELIGRAIGELGLEDDIGMRIIAIKRGRRWTYNPSDDFVLRNGDVTVVRGYAEGREKLLSLVGTTSSENR
ncbi:MAG: potassium channel family protein, partial [Candidatus Bathyarchaeia archaeon]